jgi:hypothetical protein
MPVAFAGMARIPGSDTPGRSIVGSLVVTS